MKLSAILIAGAALVTLSGPALAADVCTRPAAPTTLAGVDPAAVTLEQLLAAKTEVSTFIGASDSYQSCVLDELAAERAAAKKAKTKVDAETVKAAQAEVAANQADKEKAGTEYNTAAKAYKAAHPT